MFMMFVILLLKYRTKPESIRDGNFILLSHLFSLGYVITKKKSLVIFLSLQYNTVMNCAQRCMVIYIVWLSNPSLSVSVGD